MSEIPEIMTRPSLLAKGDHWTHTCPHCQLCVQGGRPGLDAHFSVVHPGVKR